ncbi:DNA replication/checkpoint protein [Cercophora scortea]|uniref:DNA replication regulator SLD2 n=1 Tax=Cercophora scortea TaxID=314031 RepID=A0AAE0I3C7_9PEZI|nr:DNA replication/checkpoint protein [Cercophora scortea]
MDDQDKADYESQSLQLRADLKKWENEWATAHGGKKPARDDIKQNADIAQKYKQYNKLRDIISGKVPPPSDNSIQRKRKQTDASLPPSHTPSKRARPATTPLKEQAHPEDTHLTAVTPSLSRRLFSPVLPTSIGPTPQKDGRVLGLFDLLGRTPSKSTGETDLPAVPIDATPSKRRAEAEAEAEAQTPPAARHVRTPSSSRNKMFFDGFLPITTPLHKRDSNSQCKATTPSSRSVSKLQFATPSFLRRTTAPLPPVDENGEWKVEPIKLPRKPLGRGLSSVVASLRKLEEEVLDEELDVLREMEETERRESIFATREKSKASSGAEPTAPKTTSDIPNAATDAEAASVLTANEPNPHLQQDKPLLLGGFDDENLYDSQEEQQLDRGQPLRIFKKKGQKRTTRRSNMKPTRFSRPTEDPTEDSDDELVPETQAGATKAAAAAAAAAADEDLLDGDDLLSGSGSEFEGGDSGDDAEEEAKKPSKQTKKESSAKKGGDKDKKGEKKEEGLVKKAVRKVKATAHANFKRLKLRNNGAKGGPAHNSRFRRRR